MDDLDFNSISGLEDILERPFLEEEIFIILKGMEEGKALRLDGFTISFFQRCWDIIQRDLLRVFEEFFHSESFYLNQFFIALIPKKATGRELIDFHPILLSSVYRIISKVLTPRLKLVMDNLNS